MATTEQLVTADDLVRMPDDGYRYELVRGELRGAAVRRIPARAHCRKCAHTSGRSHGGRQTWRASILQRGSSWKQTLTMSARPSVAFIRQGRVAAAADVDGYFPGPPDVAIEIISSSELYMDVDERVADYLASGTLAVVVVNPLRRTVRVHQPASDTVEYRVRHAGSWRHRARLADDGEGHVRVGPNFGTREFRKGLRAYSSGR